MGLIFFVYSANRPKIMFQKAAPVRPSETAQKSIDLIFQKKIYQELNGQDSFQSLTLIEFGIKIWLQSSSKHRWDFYLCHLCTSCRRKWTTSARYSSEVRTLPKYPNLGERSDHLGKYLGICKLTNHTLYTWIRQHKVQFYLNSSSACLK